MIFWGDGFPVEMISLAVLWCFWGFLTHPVINWIAAQRLPKHLVNKGSLAFKWGANGPDLISLYAVQGGNEFDYAHNLFQDQPLFAQMMVELSSWSSLHGRILAYAWGGHQVADQITHAIDGYSNTKRTLYLLPFDQPWVRLVEHGLAEFGVDVIQFWVHGVDFRRDGFPPVLWDSSLINVASQYYQLLVDWQVTILGTDQIEKMGSNWLMMITVLHWLITRLPKKTMVKEK